MQTISQPDVAGPLAGETANVIAGGAGERTVLPGRVESSSHGLVALRLNAQPAPTSGGLAPGARVYLVHESGRVDPADVVSLETGAETLLVLGVLSLAPTSANRRDFHRVPMRLMEVQTVLVTEKSAARFRLKVLDLSGGGARLLSARPMAAGNMLSLRLPLLDNRITMDVRARVVWIRPVFQSWQVGIQFIDLPDPTRDLIVRTVFIEETRLRRSLGE